MYQGHITIPVDSGVNDVINDVTTFTVKSKFWSTETSLIFDLECQSKAQNAGILIAHCDVILHHHVFFIIKATNFCKSFDYILVSFMLLVIIALCHTCIRVYYSMIIFVFLVIINNINGIPWAIIFQNYDNSPSRFIGNVAFTVRWLLMVIAVTINTRWRPPHNVGSHINL